MVKIDRKPYEHHPNVMKLIAANLTWNGIGKFDWKVIIDGRGFNIRKKILPILLQVTKKHCAFCDFHPLSEDVLNPLPIEHFYPKCQDKYPEKAYQWENLFPSCNGCTAKKGVRFSEDLLKPDEDSYSFEAYFEITGDGKLVPSYAADDIIRRRAEVTIDIYKLNHRGDLLSQRKQAMSDYPKLLPITDIDERKFRFIIPLLLKNKDSKSPDDIINEFTQ